MRWAHWGSLYWTWESTWGTPTSSSTTGNWRTPSFTVWTWYTTLHKDNAAAVSWVWHIVLYSARTPDVQHSAPAVMVQPSTAAVQNYCNNRYFTSANTICHTSGKADVINIIDGKEPLPLGLGYVQVLSINRFDWFEFCMQRKFGFGTGSVLMFFVSNSFGCTRVLKFKCKDNIARSCLSVSNTIWCRTRNSAIAEKNARRV